ncbi:amino acid ABC transporter permease [Kaistia sp. 32K]|uniref:amino acid ABC transporter permease n=1 Tax=Kaistia sp. 32K TaxID=2795690 RepID=UPI0019165367|nr:ABC transporter permease subunit [Kaistia sp. 32K]BCP56067.1 amino acid ABC transporter permease [Kaistia sp. 32K]
MSTVTPDAPAPGLPVLKNLLGERPLAQIVLFVGVIAALGWLGQTMTGNMARVGILPGFGFLSHPTNFAIGETLITYSPESSFARAIFVGFLNTLVVSLLGCVIATVLGVALGFARLSENPLLSGTVRAYVELIRNTPLLLQLFFWSATFKAFPAARQALEPVAGVFLSNRGIFIPAFRFESGTALAAVSVALVIAATGLALRRRIGLSVPTALLAALVALALLAALLVASGGLRVDLPVLKGFNIVGGLSLTTEFGALLVGLFVNASALIAEVVRSGIQSVPRGQWEAARSLGLHRGQIYAKIVLPQALRVITPLMTSNYLSLIKNSSLAIAIGYPDLVSILSTSANQTGQALETILIMAGIYLSISLAVSYAMNRYNKHYALRGLTR